ncbi:hypothetical protein EVAR_66946_1 [Eumeta japonica]|uniref:Uncharacterized protein n=1 Tax=Eumeta variegata TaxID=151549 RepID=A0A4C1SCW3_EUMVA|nr:hypothetical protein EVAR_66946_1 [Eumeta japonica]
MRYRSAAARASQCGADRLKLKEAHVENEWSQIAINGSPGARGRRRPHARRIEKLGPRGLHPAHCGSGAADDPDRRRVHDVLDPKA